MFPCIEPTFKIIKYKWYHWGFLLIRGLIDGDETVMVYIDHLFTMFTPFHTYTPMVFLPVKNLRTASFTGFDQLTNTFGTFPGTTNMVLVTAYTSKPSPTDITGHPTPFNVTLLMGKTLADV